MAAVDALLKRSGADLVSYALLHENNATMMFGAETIAERSGDGLKRLYKKLALRLHPDKNDHPEAGRAFQVLQATFEMTLTLFESGGAIPPPSGGAAPPPPPSSSSRAAPPATSQQRSARPSPSHPPPPPPPQANTSSRGTTYPPPPPNAHGRQQQRHSSGTHQQHEDHAFDDIPLPPDVFEDLAWEEWTDTNDLHAHGEKKKKKGHGGGAFPPPPPPPPPPPQHHGGWPPPPPPPPPPPCHTSPQHTQFEVPPARGEQPSTRRQSNSLPTELPTLDLSDGESVPQAPRQHASARANTKRRSTGAASSSHLPNVSDASDDEEDMSERMAAKRLAAAQQKKLMAAAAKREEEQSKRVAASSKSLRQLFAEFGISDDDEDGVPVAPRRSAAQPSSPPRQTAPPPTQTHLPATRNKAPTMGATNIFAAAAGVPPSMATTTAFVGASAPCTNCGTGVTIAGDPSIAVMCPQCRRFFVPALCAAVGKGKGGGARSRGEPCRCGKAKRGSCFMCE